MDNANSPEYLEKIKNQVIENLRRTAHAPSVQMTDVPRDPEGLDDEADAMLDDLDEDEHKDQRYTKRRWDKYVEKDGELSESEDEEENENNGVRRQTHIPKRRNMMDYQNPNAVPDDEEVAAAARAQSHDPDAMVDIDKDAAINGSAHSDTSNADDSGVSTPKSEHDSLPTGDVIMQDADVPISDEPVPPASNGAHLAAEGPQEATPPASPPAPAIAAEPVAPTEVATDVGNEAMDEGDTLDNPEVAQENGIWEREEKATELTQRSEET